MCNKEVILKTYFRYMYDIKINLSNIHSIIRLVSTSHLSCNAKCLIYFFFYFNYVKEKHALLTVFKRAYTGLRTSVY